MHKLMRNSSYKLDRALTNLVYGEINFIFYSYFPLLGVYGENRPNLPYMVIMICESWIYLKDH